MQNDPGFEQLLDATRAALLAGDLAALAPLAERCEQLLAGGLPRDPAGLGRIAAKADRNAALLTAAARGVASARRRVAELSGGARFLTYDSAGRRGVLTEEPAAAARRL
jgi:hypothetical protein